MNKFLVIIMIIVAALLLWLGFKNYEAPTPTALVSETSNEIEEVALATPTSNNITDAQVAYTAQKVFFNKPTEQIIGTTDEVQGVITYQDNILSGSATISTDNITTGNSGRDQDVRRILDSIITAKIPTQTIIENEVQDISVEMTINGVTQTLVFTTDVKVSGSIITLSGSTDFLMSDFGIMPPNIINIYTVEDQAQLTFDISADYMNLGGESDQQTTTITGTILETQGEKDGYTVVLEGNDGVTYQTIISIPNLNPGFTFDLNDIKVGNNITITGEVWEMNGVMQLTAREVINNN